MATAQMEVRGLTKRRAGRLSGKTPEICQRIVADVRAGQPLKAVVAGVGVAYKTLNQWRDRDSKFAAELESARLDGLKVQRALKLSKRKSTEVASTKPRSLGGQPSKKTREAIERALETARSGLPLRFCAAAAHVSLETLGNWREQDPDFAQALETARAAGARKKWDKILAAGDRDAPGSWQPLAWALERGFPAEFSRPEIQLAAVHQSNFTTNNTLAISVEMAASLQARAEPIRKKIERLFANHSGGREASVRQLEAPMNGDLPEGEMSLPGLVMPPDPVPSHWWAQLVRGDNTREVEPAAAVKICRMILEDVVGKVRAQSTRIEFDSNWPILLRDLHSKLETLCGSRGWTALTKRGKNRKDKILLL